MGQAVSNVAFQHGLNSKQGEGLFEGSCELEGDRDVRLVRVMQRLRSAS